MQQLGQRVDDADDDEQTRESYNFAPGYYGAVLRAETPDTGGMNPEEEEERPQDHTEAAPEQSEATGEHQEDEGEKPVRYRLQSMKWGLIPFWTKRNPDYGSLMRTINCRDDSLMENRGMWTSMKKKKRCIVVCQGFYEWLKKGPTGKERIPHFIKRKDGNLLCFAGLWDCVQYEG
jgi:putative SOS response-associated peptidase YedK